MNLEIIPQAQEDIAEAARYYKNQRPGLDDDFLAEIDDAVAEIVANPFDVCTNASWNTVLFG